MRVPSTSESRGDPSGYRTRPAATRPTQVLTADLIYYSKAKQERTQNSKPFFLWQIEAFLLSFAAYYK